MPASSSGGGAGQADILVTATTSRKPVFESELMISGSEKPNFVWKLLNTQPADPRDMSKVFLRDATGLVRAGGMWSTFAMNWIFTGNSIGIIGAFLVFAYPLVSPGGNWIFLATIAALTGAMVSVTYGFLSVVMPRSGGDYVFVGRTLHPSLGFMASFGWAIWLPLVFGWAGKNMGPLALQAILSTWSAITGDKTSAGITNALNDPNLLFVLGTITIILFCLLAIAPLKAYFRIQNVAFVFMIIALLITVGVLFSNDPTTFKAALNGVTGTNSYDSLIHAAAGSIPPNNLEANFAGWAEWEGLAIFAMASAFIGSEIKNVKKSQLLGTGISSLILSVTFILILAGTIHAVGSDFLTAASYLYGSSAYTISFPPYYSSFVILLAQNPILVILFSIGFVLGGVWFMVQNVILTQRITLAWAFDRLFPEAFGKVSDRFKTPMWGVMFSFVIGEIALIVYVYTNWLGFFSQLLALAVSQAFVALAATVLPFKKKELFESSPVAYKIGGVPVLSLLGFGSLVTLLVFIYINVVDSALGANSFESITLISLVFIIGFVSFFVATALRKSQGIDLTTAFKQLPPE